METFLIDSSSDNSEYERRVVQQMLEFTYRYTTEILEEARVYSNHAKNASHHAKASKGIDIDDIKLAVQETFQNFIFWKIF